MAIYNTYDCILQDNPIENDALDYARGIDWSEIECRESSIAYGRYVDTVNGIEVYYDFGADYYFFCPEGA
jgi:hypothetical protein